MPTTRTPSTVTTSTFSTQTSSLSTIGEVCGVTALAGGPAPAVGVKHPELLKVCASGPFKLTDSFSIKASNGNRYEAYVDNLGGWSAPVARRHISGRRDRRVWR
jgi:hypothetical protein